MTFVVDTNVLVYASNIDCKEHEPCRRLIDRWRRSAEPWYASWSILYEYSRVVSHPRVLERPLEIVQAWAFLAALFEARSFGLLVATERHREIAESFWQERPELSGNLIHDAHTAILMREHGVRRIFTRDADFHRFPGIEVLDPLRH